MMHPTGPGQRGPQAHQDPLDYRPAGKERCKSEIANDIRLSCSANFFGFLLRIGGILTRQNCKMNTKYAVREESGRSVSDYVN